jgi:hypothetical protein
MKVARQERSRNHLLNFVRYYFKYRLVRRRAEPNGAAAGHVGVSFRAGFAMALIYAISIAVAAQMFIYSGLTFMAGKLFPTTLTPIYNLMPTASYRVAFATLTVMLVGNYFFQRLYSIQPVLIAGIISTVVGILIVNIVGLIIEQKLPDRLLVLGIIILLTGAVVCVYARSRM